MTEIEKPEAMGTTTGTATPVSFQTSEGSVGKKLDAIEVTVIEMAAAPTSYKFSKTSIEGKAEDADFAVTEGATTPRSFQTSEGSFLEKATAAEHIPYLSGWRLHFLSLRLAPLDHNCCFANSPSAWRFCSSLSTSKSQ